MSFEMQSFDADVLDASRGNPVLVDFWAPWCGPCRMLGPVLEKLAGEANGTWRLVKINSDEHPDISARYGIRGIPAVKLFVDGEVVDEFTGALPERAVQQWLEKALPSENKARIAESESLILSGNPKEAETLLRQVLNEEPTNARACALLAEILVFTSPEEATAFARRASTAEPSFIHTAEAVKTIARLLLLAKNPVVLKEEPGKDAYIAAIQALEEKDFDRAIEGFIDVIRTHRYYDDDGSRKACVALFNLLGPEHPATQKHRRVFDRALY